MRSSMTSVLLIGLLVAAMAIVGCSRGDPSNHLMGSAATLTTWGVNGNQGVYCTDLTAGQNINAGTVCVEVVDNNGDASGGEKLCITYTTTGGWQLVETHLWVGTSMSTLPMTKSGNPIPGQFPYASGNITGATTWTYCVDLDQFGGEAALCGKVLYVAAHAALRKNLGGGKYQTETGWGAGSRITAKGNWATCFSVGLECYTVPPPPGTCETGFAFDGDQSGCFQNYPEFLDNPSRWGWTNGPYGPGTYTFDIYVGAGLCDITTGMLVGTLSVVYDGSTAVVTYTMNSGFALDETHLYVGNELFARDKQGEFTLAPGQYPNKYEGLGGATSDTYTVAVTGDIYIVAHAIVCWGKGPAHDEPPQPEPAPEPGK